MKLYMLSFDTDNGEREDWNVFYTPVEAFSSEQLRQDRIDYLTNAIDEDGYKCEYSFHKYEIDLDASVGLKDHENDEDWEEDDTESTTQMTTTAPSHTIEELFGNAGLDEDSLTSIMGKLREHGTKVYGVPSGSGGSISFGSNGMQIDGLVDMTPTQTTPNTINAFTGWIELYNEQSLNTFKRNPYVVAIDDYVSEQLMIEMGYLFVESYDKFRPAIAETLSFTDKFHNLVKMFNDFDEFGLKINFTENDAL